MIIDGQHIPVTKQWLKDVLDVRIKKQGLKIEDLFVITRAINNEVEGETKIETEYGKILVFFRNDLPEGKLAFILHKSKFDYPKKNVRLEVSPITGQYKVSRKESYVN